MKLLHCHKNIAGDAYFQALLKCCVIASMFLLMLSCDRSSLAQTTSIKPGQYICYAPSYGAAIPQYNPQLGMIWVPSVTYNQSAIGDLMIAEKGRYSMPAAKWSGTYSLDNATGKMTVTGGLTKASQIQYMANGGWIFIQIDGLKNECYLDGKRSTTGHSSDAAKSESPELKAKRSRLIYGNFLVTTTDITMSFVGRVVNWNLATNAQETLFGSGQANRSLNGELINVDKNGRLVITNAQGQVIDDLTRKINFPGRSMVVRMVEMTFLNPALSPNGDRIALSLAKVGNFGVYLGSVVIILDRKGNRLAELDGYAQTAWLPDGRLIVTGSYYGGDTNGKRGLHITDTSFTKITPIAKELEAASQPDVSKDGKKIAFWSNQNLWVVNTDGSNLKKIYTSKRGLKHPSWSPKGDAIVLLDSSFSLNGKFEFVIIDAETGEFFVVADDKGNRLNADGKVVWY